MKEVTTHDLYNIAMDDCSLITTFPLDPGVLGMSKHTKRSLKYSHFPTVFMVDLPRRLLDVLSCQSWLPLIDGIIVTKWDVTKVE
jgi:hypothetical protein